MKALIKLSRASGLYPECMALKELKIRAGPVAAGGFGDIYKGQLRDQMIAVKVLKVYEESDMDKLLRVALSLDSSFIC